MNFLAFGFVRCFLLLECVQSFILCLSFCFLFVRFLISLCNHLLELVHCVLYFEDFFLFLFLFGFLWVFNFIDFYGFGIIWIFMGFMFFFQWDRSLVTSSHSKGCFAVGLCVSATSFRQFQDKPFFSERNQKKYQKNVER